MFTVLVTGGAGYIGSHTVRALADAGYEVVVYDNLTTGHGQAVAGYKLVVGDIRDAGKLDDLFRSVPVDTVVHLAGSPNAGESVVDPGAYFENNTTGTLCLLRSMVRSGVSRLVFSSTAAIYGEPVRVPIEEMDPKAPTNAYGLSKWMAEQMLDWFQRAHGLRSISLRYFNAAGAHPLGEIGEARRDEFHLIPLVLQVPLGKRNEVRIFGDDYETPDGTCIRDYVHVSDIAVAHVLAVKALEEGARYDAFNIGSGKGSSVKEVIELARRITQRPIPARLVPRRAGDPARLIASSEKLLRVLGWRPCYGDLSAIIDSAWRWLQQHPDGYDGSFTGLTGSTALAVGGGIAPQARQCEHVGHSWHAEPHESQQRGALPGEQEM